MPQILVKDEKDLRDWLAGMALVGLLGHPQAIEPYPHEEKYAKRAYALADAMLDERRKA
jgi:hypothetical protein